MADIIRNAIIRMAIEQGDSKIKAPDMSAVLAAKQKEIELAKKLKAESDQARQAEVDWFNQIAVAQAEVNSELEEEIQRTEELEATHTEAMASMQTASESVTNALAGIGEGMFLVARAGALLGGSTEDLKKMLDMLRLIQGTFDLFKGAFKIIDGIRKLQAALTLATEARAAAATAHAAASNIEAAGLAKVAAALIFVQASFPPLLLVMAAIAVAAAAAAAIWHFFGDEAEDAEDKLASLKEEQQRTTDVFLARQAAQISAVGRLHDTETRLRQLRKGEKAEAKEIAELKKRNVEVELADLAKKEQQILAVGANTKDEITAQANALKLVSEQRKTIISDAERLAVLEGKATQRKQKDLDLLKKQIQSQEQLLKTAKEALKTEQQKVLSLAAQFASLSKNEQLEIQELRKAIDSGTATTEQLKRATTGPRAALLGEKAGEQLGQRGLDEGGFVPPPELVKGVAEAQENAAKIQATQDKSIGEANKATGGDASDASGALGQIDTASKRMSDKLQTFLDDNADLLGKIIQQQSNLQNELDQTSVAQAGATQ